MWPAAERVLAGRHRSRVQHSFTGPALKRHNPRTVRKNVGADYHGCLIVGVRQSADLYRRIEGWVRRDHG